jgi:hypothetical protein
VVFVNGDNDNPDLGAEDYVGWALWAVGFALQVCCPPCLSVALAGCHCTTPLLGGCAAQVAGDVTKARFKTTSKPGER